ncbi:MAG: T9SS type A sorting domain-containing protein, partial [bacterium]|nr:T9SS type A sorting domain-containing protein [bacterium]
IPGQPLHTVISYYIKAKDVLGNTKTTPEYTFRIEPTYEFSTIICNAYNVFITTNDEIITIKPDTLDCGIPDKKKEISFIINKTGTLGWSEIVVPWDLLHGNSVLGGFVVKLNDISVNCEITEFPGHFTKIYFTYEDGGYVTICAPICVGDVNEDGKIDMKDIREVAKRFGDTPWYSNAGVPWLPRADIDKNKKIDMKDIRFVAKLFGLTKESDILALLEDIVGHPIAPPVLTLYQNFPNPFSSGTLIRYGVPRNGRVSLKVYNSAGQIVETIVDEEKLPGYYSVGWSSEKMPDGIYFLRLETQDRVITKKMILVK